VIDVLRSGRLYDIERWDGKSLLIDTGWRLLAFLLVEVERGRRS
jgi:hypothetical protein